MLAEVAYASFYAGDAGAMRLAAERAASIAPPDPNGRIAFFTLITRGMALIFSGEDEPGAPAVRAAVEVLERSDELRDDLRLLAWAAMGSVWLREADAGRALLYRALETARGKSAVGALPFLLEHVAVDEAGADRWAEAQAGYHEAIGLAREIGQYSDLGVGLACLARLEARLGRSEQSRRHADEALSLSRKMGLGLAEVWAHAALGDLELGLGRPEAALAHFEEQRAVLRSHGIADPDLSPVPELVEICLRLTGPIVRLGPCSSSGTGGMASQASSVMRATIPSTSAAPNAWVNRATGCCSAGECGSGPSDLARLPAGYLSRPGASR